MLLLTFLIIIFGPIMTAVVWCSFALKEGRNLNGSLFHALVGCILALVIYSVGTLLIWVPFGVKSGITYDALHNFLLDTGLGGLLWMLAFALVIYYRVWRHRRWQRIGNVSR